MSLVGKTIVREFSPTIQDGETTPTPLAPPFPRRLWVVHGHLFGLVRRRDRAKGNLKQPSLHRVKLDPNHP